MARDQKALWRAGPVQGNLSAVKHPILVLDERLQDEADGLRDTLPALRRRERALLESHGHPHSPDIAETGAHLAIEGPEAEAPVRAHRRTGGDAGQRIIAGGQ